MPADQESLEILWDELGGQSTRLWNEVEEVVAGAWSWLEHHPQALAPR
jgi:hypothetical protein